MIPRDPARIADFLTDLAGTSLEDVPALLGLHTLTPDDRRRLIGEFRDEFGHRRDVDPALLASLLLVPPPPPPSPRVRNRSIELWWAAAAGDASFPEGSLTPVGSLAPELREGAIEPWIEAELSALHALSLLAARPTPDPPLRARLDDASRWMMAEIQPDNGTNRPWGVHVFLARWCARGDTDARHYAETLLHNCQVALARPDRMSAAILLSAARVLPGLTR